MSTALGKHLTTELKPICDAIQALQSASPTTLKIKNLPEFDGSRDRAESFMRACLMSMQFNPSSFVDDQRTIIWMMSFMTEGRAATFREQAMAEAGETEDGLLRWKTLKEFQSSRRSFDSSLCQSESARKLW